MEFLVAMDVGKLLRMIICSSQIDLKTLQWLL